MTTDQAKAFLEAIRAKNIRTKNSTIVQSSCPLAKWTHQKGVDVNPSFALFCSPGEATHYHCFTCGNGSAEDLINSISFYSKDDLATYDLKSARLILENEEFVVPLPEYSEGASQDQVFEEWPDWWLDSFSTVYHSVEAMDYLKTRGVDESISKEFELHYDPSRKMIVFPYWNVYGKLAGARGRSILSGVTGEKKHYDYRFNGRNNAKLVLYNEQVLNLPGPVVVVEGQFDVIRVSQRWKKVVGNLTAFVVKEKFKKLLDSDCLVHITDPDKTGIDSRAGWSDLCQKYGITYKTVDLPPTNSQGEKVDPGNCHPDYLYDKIQEVLG
jgi:DNA primase